MLTLRKEQLEALRAAAEARLPRDLARRLAERFPEEAAALGEPAVRKLVEEELGTARAGGLYRYESLARFVEKAFLARAGQPEREPLSVTGLTWDE
jgi:hypothetical protein